MKHIACRVVVEGVVQGVGFRRSAMAQARARHVAGWIRNTEDGEVEMQVEGLPASVQGIVAWMHRGPQAAQVTGVRVEESEILGATVFAKRPTLAVEAVG